MKVERIYTEDVPIWKCNTHNCGVYFHLEMFTGISAFEYDNSVKPPFCPCCGYKNCDLATALPEFSDE
jgi:hypothetical protein